MDRKLLQYLVEYLVEEGKAHGCALPPAAADAAQGGLVSLGDVLHHLQAHLLFGVAQLVACLGRLHRHHDVVQFMDQKTPLFCHQPRLFLSRICLQYTINTKSGTSQSLLKTR